MDQAGLKCCVLALGHVEQLTTANWFKLNFIMYGGILTLTHFHHGGILSWWEYAGKPNHTWVKVLTLLTINNQYNKDKAVKEEAPNLVRESKRELQFDDSNVEDCKGVLLELGVTQYSADPNLDIRQI